MAAARDFVKGELQRRSKRGAQRGVLLISGRIPTPTKLSNRSMAALGRGDTSESYRIARWAYRAFPDNALVIQTFVNAVSSHLSDDPEAALQTTIPAVDRLLGQAQPSQQTWNVLTTVICLELSQGKTNTRSQQYLLAQLSNNLAPVRTTIGAITTRLIDASKVDTATAFAEWCHQTTGSPDLLWPVITCYQEQCRWDDAERARQSLEAERAFGQRGVQINRARSALRSGDAALALEYAKHAKPKFDGSQTTVMVQAWTLLGDHQAILDHLENTDSGLAEPRVLATRFKSEWALGNRDRAIELLPLLDSLQGVTAQYLELYRAAYGEEATEARLRQATQNINFGDADKAFGLAEAWWEFGNPEEAIDIITTTAERGATLTQAGRLLLARCQYAVRDFEQASAIIRSLAGTSQEWAATKLQARIDIETGDFAAAVKNRRAHQRPLDGPDEALFHGLLGLHRYDEAFAEMPDPIDFRNLSCAFPTSAERHPAEHVGHRFVIADAGPGDELQDASSYSDLITLSDKLTITCDPRLQTLLSRSFPSIEFIESPRLLRPLMFGSHAKDRPPRADNPLSRLLTAAANERAESADAVVLGRAVKTVRDYQSGPRPEPAHIVPDAELVQRFKRRWSGERPTVGFVWRSEYRTGWRNIHYLSVAHLAPLLEADWDLVCLQYDVAPDERTELGAMSRNPITYLDDIDFRDDFESAAAVLFTLDAVTGIGTAATVLAASVGTPTFVMAASHFSTWLKHPTSDQDFWYQAGRQVAADPPWDKDALVLNSRNAIEAHIAKHFAIDSAVLRVN